MTEKPTTLADLPHFTISSISSGGHSTRLSGVFDHLVGVAKGRCWLFSRNAESIIGDLTELDEEAKSGVFITTYPEGAIVVGMSFPYVDGYWDTSDVEMVLDEGRAWKRLDFEAQDAAMFRYEGGGILRKASEIPPLENSPDEIIPGGWNHEHCKLCWKHIEPKQIAYVYAGSKWLCEACYENYVVPHDLSFMEVHGRKWPTVEDSR